ncbi:glyoxylase-like metal-dependent hydrolase (beta-lactamase superfamily II) [Halorubrum alkaliphilum]|uniref:Glyoxylase-like metal-dependent hydrolase (Beta-lactamase superfamily II) n=1 Tax=Halorubrum alkaliphilum TaxID=261290 RepID=A0A8T4GG68_9EURY|nr:MBL fold metallo-hydrolase [Halorubrum alkaliphilum]MBP1922182.1 glyoxylase-like metal-dependent hydrolase (beta-lactamase superfamily II) [Halorubrum alkaliphilum]
MKRIQLGNTVFEGENDVYLIETDATVLVDTGVAIPETREELREGLAAHGVAFADVDAIFLTHWHPDHAGLAGEIQAAGDADVFVHEADASLVDGSEPHFAEDPDAQRRVFDRWGMPEPARDRLREFYGTVGTGLRGRDATVTTFGDGETFEAGGLSLEAVHLPGHTAGLSAFAFDPGTLPGHDPVDRRERGESAEPTASPGRGTNPEAFTGDALLPRYTPNVGGADVRVEDPLGKYADSLARIVERDWGAAHPGHRERIDEPSRRAAEILAHHRHRTRRVLDVLADGPATAWEVSAALFGDLEAIHVLHGPGEASAHLDHLVAAGVVERDGTAYRLVEPLDDAAVGVDALFPTTPLDDEVAASAED